MKISISSGAVRKNLLLSKYALALIFVLGFLTKGATSYAQSQNIGFAPAMDGGFEGQASSGAASLFSSAPSSYYTVSNSASVVLFNGTGGRTGSGPKYISWTVASNSGYAFYTPSDGAVQSSTSYVVQFWYKNSSSSSSKAFTIAVSPDGTNAFGSGAGTSTLSATSWTKASVVVTSGSSSNTQNGMIKFNPSSTFSTPYYIDDIVMYPGSSLDNSVPDNATAATVSTSANNSLTTQWTAPGSGTDGGGYIVLRYTADPSSATAPTQNAIYAVGNTIGTGTIVYIGANTTFIDNGLTQGVTYYYRVYTADKAFNYSSGVTLNGTTTNNSNITNLTVTNKTYLATLGDSVGIGTTTPTEKLDVHGNIKAVGLVIPTNAGFGKVLTSDSNGVATWQTSTGGGSPGWSITGSDLFSSNTGNVGIGTTDTKGYKFAVNGDAIFTKIKIKSYSGWADFAFEDKYQLRPLPDLEQYIIQNKHLPGIPSAKEVYENGFDVGDNQNALLLKIEELTLYIINQAKVVEDQKKQMEALKEQNKQIQQQINALKKFLMNGTN